MDATNAKGENVLHKLVQSWKDSKMLVGCCSSLLSDTQSFGSVRSEFGRTERCWWVAAVTSWGLLQQEVIF